MTRRPVIPVILLVLGWVAFAVCIRCLSLGTDDPETLDVCLLALLCCSLFWLSGAYGLATFEERHPQ